MGAAVGAGSGIVGAAGAVVVGAGSGIVDAGGAVVVGAVGGGSAVIAPDAGIAGAEGITGASIVEPPESEFVTDGATVIVGPVGADIIGSSSPVPPHAAQNAVQRLVSSSFLRSVGTSFMACL